MDVKKCPNCGKWTMFETPTGRECSKCGFAVTAPINDGKGGKGYQCPIYQCPILGIFPLSEVIKTVETIDALLTDQTTKGKKEGYSDAASEYEAVYSDLKKKYGKLISDIESKKTDLYITSDKGLIELEKLEAERDRLKAELKNKAEDASETFNISDSSILSSLSSGSSRFFTSSSMWSHDFRDSIIAKKKKERMQARRDGYMEAKVLYEEKISQLKDQYRKTKADADIELSNCANRVSVLLNEIETKLNEIETIKSQIADLKIAMGD